jgi:hypothetical protein
MVSVSSALMTKAANKRLHAERRHTLSVMMQTLLPSGEAQAVRWLDLPVGTVLQAFGLGL